MRLKFRYLRPNCCPTADISLFYSVPREKAMKALIDSKTRQSVKRRRPSASHFMGMAFDVEAISAGADRATGCLTLSGDPSSVKYWKEQPQNSTTTTLTARKLASYRGYLNNGEWFETKNF